MNFSDVLKALNQASAFELYRMRAGIDRVLEQPQWLDSIRSRLRVGQTIAYFEPRENASSSALIIELRRKRALVLDIATQKRWLIEYAAINVDGADVEIREQPRQGWVAMRSLSARWSASSAAISRKEVARSFVSTTRP
jgi:hypothetical protein